jgi:ABC-2 type transport system permease protein
MLSSALGLAVLLVCGLLVGWRWHGSVADTLAAIGLLLLRFALVWVGVYLGLVVRNPEAVAAVRVLVWPLGFPSNAIAPTATMPGWLAWSPSGTRSGHHHRDPRAVRQPRPGRRLLGRPARPAHGGGVALAILAVFVPLAVHRWQRLSR